MIALDDSWRIQSSADVSDGGERISRPAFDASGWYPATLPATVLGALVESGVYPDPFTGTNFLHIPGQGPPHENFSLHPMPDDSPFRVSWWFRREFDAAAGGDDAVWVRFLGINYRADVWLNGHRIADARTVAGAYRIWEFEVSRWLRRGTSHVLALEVFPPEPDDLAITWVDWNPSPPDKNMGLWQRVELHRSGPVALRDPQVVVDLDDRHGSALLTVHAIAVNASERAQRALIRGTVAGQAIAVSLELAPLERRPVIVAGPDGDAVRLGRPRLWWPRAMGAQPMYELALSADVDGRSSDAVSLPFGIRRVTAELTERGHALFRVNGRPVLIRGGGWAKDLFQREDPSRDLREYEYVKDIGLNAIRFEGMLERREFLDRCDRDGLLVIAGWCCCDHWERWEHWKAEDHEIAAESLRSQVRRVRHHPSVIAWWYGSDNPPPAAVEQRYLDVLREERWPNPAHSSASQKPAELTGTSGMKMLGPYDYVPPHYWYADRVRGGAFGFATEIGPGPAIPPIESLRAMLTAEHLWPIDDVWTHHGGGGPFKDLTLFNDALERRYGPSASAEEYVMKAQLSAYESQRAMFEAYTRNRYLSTGVIQWMLNNAWPSLIWHLWDWYLRPGAGYFGTKKACEPLHVQYSYDDRSIVVVNLTGESVTGLVVEARVFSPDGTTFFRQRAECPAPPDSSTRLFDVPEPPGTSPTYFCRLDLRTGAGDPVSRNLYWLSKAKDAIDHGAGNWYYSPMTAWADFSGLRDLPAAAVTIAARREPGGPGREAFAVELTNPSSALAFFLRLQVMDQDGTREVLPVLWEDNFVSLMPGERLRLRGSVRAAERREEALAITLTGWNVTAAECII